MDWNNAYGILFGITLTLLGLFIGATLIKSVAGPRISDRLVTVNMISTLVTSCIAVLAVILTDETYLIDVCLIYVLISFLSVVIFCNVFINEYLLKKKKKNERKEKNK